MDEGFVLPNAAAFHALVMGQVDDVTVVPHWLPDGSLVLTAQVRIAPADAPEVSRRAALWGGGSLAAGPRRPTTGYLRMVE
jgi:hypothetical protein